MLYVSLKHERNKNQKKRNPTNPHRARANERGGGAGWVELVGVVGHGRKQVARDRARQQRNKPG